MTLLREKHKTQIAWFYFRKLCIKSKSINHLFCLQIHRTEGQLKSRFSVSISLNFFCSLCLPVSLPLTLFYGQIFLVYGFTMYLSQCQDISTILIWFTSAKWYNLLTLTLQIYIPWRGSWKWPWLVIYVSISIIFTWLWSKPSRFTLTEAIYSPERASWL